MQRVAVAPKRRFGLGAPGDVVPRVLIEVGAGLVDELVEILEFLVACAELDPSEAVITAVVVVVTDVVVTVKFALV